VLTALVWSADIFDESMRSATLTVVGMVVVVIGLNVLIFAGRTLHKEDGKSDIVDKTASRESACLISTDIPVTVEHADLAFIRGVAGAIFAGLFGGSYLYPSEETNKGTLFVPSMGIGCLVAAPVFGALLVLAQPSNEAHPFVPPSAVFRSAAPWMLAGGAVNVLAIILVLKVTVMINRFIM
jgi:Na+-transporting methylmalonyl-CoA/oxaloacetate decarboxylase gamma subunit